MCWKSKLLQNILELGLRFSRWEKVLYFKIIITFKLEMKWTTSTRSRTRTDCGNKSQENGMKISIMFLLNEINLLLYE